MAEKSDDVRLLDVFVFGPFWIWSARHMPTPALRAIMAASGMITIVYNGMNYLDDQEPIPEWRRFIASFPFGD